MNFLPAILIAGAVYLAFRHVPTVAALLRLEFSFYTFDVKKIETDVINTSVTVRVKNSSKTDVMLQNINAGITLNNKLIGLISHNYDLLIRGNSSQYLTILLDIKKSQVGAELWNMVINKQVEFKFEINGKVTANGAQYPLVVTWTMDDIIELINPKGGETTVINPPSTGLKDRVILPTPIVDNNLNFVNPESGESSPGTGIKDKDILPDSIIVN